MAKHLFIPPENKIMEESFVAAQLEIPEVEKRKFFGWDCLTFNRNAYLAWKTGDEIAVKVSVEDFETAIEWEGTEKYDPSGKNRPMKQWIYASREAAYSHWPALAEMAVAYAATLPPKK